MRSVFFRNLDAKVICKNQIGYNVLFAINTENINRDGKQFIQENKHGISCQIQNLTM